MFNEGNSLKNTIENSILNGDTIFNEIINNQEYNTYWKNLHPSNNDYYSIKIPILTITGYYDGDQPGALYFYQQHKLFGNKEFSKNHNIIIGPWNHSGTLNPKETFYGLTFKNGVINMKQLKLDWFNHTLKGKKLSSAPFKNKVYSYVMGDNMWKCRDYLDDKPKDTLCLYLNSHTKSPSLFHSGKLSSQILNVANKYSEIRYNPIDTTNLTWPFYHDSYVNLNVAADSNLIVYHSEKLKTDITLDGRIEAEFFISINTPDTDFRCIFYEVRPDGSYLFLAEDIIRASYRNSLVNKEILKDDKINVYHFNSYFYSCRKVNKGSRIRLVFGPLNSKHFLKNYNSGNNPLNDSKEFAKKVLIKLHHSKQYPSKIKIPTSNKL